MAKSKFWNFQNKGEDGELMLYGDISSSTWFGDEITPKDFKKDLDGLGAIKNLNIYINSGGGDVFAGQAIYSMLKRHEANKTVYIDGLAASIASVIAMAGDKIVMPKNAMLMIHNAWTIAAGNANDFRKMAEDMDKIDESIQQVYVAKTGMEQSEIADLMNKETWLTADDAINRGFADEIEKDKKLAASVEGAFFMLNGVQFDLDRYQNKPEIETYEPVDNGAETQPVANNQEQFNAIRQKILCAYEEDN